MNENDQKQNIQTNKEDHAMANRNRQKKIYTRTKQEDKKQTGIGEVADYTVVILHIFV